MGWGTIGPSDWMAMSTFTNALGNQFERQRDTKAYSTYIMGLQQTNGEYRPPTDESFRGTMWHKAQEDFLTLKTRREQLERASIERQRLTAAMESEKYMGMAAAAHEAGNEKDYRTAYRGLLNTYSNYVPDGHFIVADSIDFDEKTMIVQDEITGERTVTDIPSMGQLSNMYEFTYDKDAFAKLGYVDAEKRREANRAIPMERITNSKGEVGYVKRGVLDPTPGSDYFGSDYTRFAKMDIYYKDNGDGTLSVIDEKEAQDMGFKSTKEQIDDVKLETEKVNLAKEKKVNRGYGLQNQIREEQLRQAKEGVGNDAASRAYARKKELIESITGSEATAMDVHKLEKVTASVDEYRSKFIKWREKNQPDEYADEDDIKVFNKKALQYSEELKRVYGLTDEMIKDPFAVFKQPEKQEQVQQPQPDIPDKEDPDAQARKDYYMRLRRLGKSKDEAIRLTQNRFGDK
jgi:hypothetical protein